MNSFSINNLSFYYGKKEIFRNVNLHIEKNDIIALIGKNGVGKSTLLKIIANFYPKYKYHNYKCAFLINKPSFYEDLSGYDNLYLVRNNSAFKKEKMDEMINFCNLKNIIYNKVSKMSLGQKMRLCFCKILLQEADIYLFDEPLNGLDPEGIILFRKIINYLNNNGKVIIISSHILKELDEIVNRVWTIKNKNIKCHNFINIDKYILTFDKIIPKYGTNRLEFNGDLIMLNKFISNLFKDGFMLYDLHKGANIENLYLGEIL